MDANAGYADVSLDPFENLDLLFGSAYIEGLASALGPGKCDEEKHEALLTVQPSNLDASVEQQASQAPPPSVPDIVSRVHPFCSRFN
jgi:hypothetical protein